MQVVGLTNKEQLNKFVGARKHSQFLQSWEWGEFQEKVSGKVIRLGAKEDGELVAVATLIKKALPLGKGYFYCPRGPVVGNWKVEIGNLLFDKIKELASKENVIFLRFEPGFEIRNSKFEICKTIDVQPSKTLILDLAKSEEEMLKNMHQKTRYNIRLAEKRGVRVTKDGGERFEEFWNLMRETCKRDGFRLHNRDYYKKMIFNNQYPISNNQSISNNQLSIKLFIAIHEKQVIAGNIVVFWGDMVTYLHGASSNVHRNVMAPYLLQWHVIKLAKSLGYKYYDFNGIDEKKWPGVTRFKAGFGGKEIKYPGTFDLVFCKMWYGVYKILRKIRRIF